MSSDEAVVIGIFTLITVILAIYQFWLGVVALGFLLVFVCVSGRIFNR
jgi:hypothetical protein